MNNKQSRTEPSLPISQIKGPLEFVLPYLTEGVLLN